MNKKGNIYVIGVLALLIMVFLLGALFISIGSGVVTFVADEITTATDGLGSITENSNLTEYHDYTFEPANNFIQMFKWLSGILIIFALLGLLIFAAAVRARPGGFLLGLYFVLVIIFIITSIFVSNMYQEFHEGNDDIALELQSMPLTSFLVIHLPFIITLFAFIGGIIIFTGVGEEIV